MTAIGIYLIISLFFVVGGMVEFAILLFLLRRSENLSYRKGSCYKFTPGGSSENQLKHTEDTRNTSVKSHKLRPILNKNSNLSGFICYARKIDFAATLIFPSTYVLFNIIYWWYYFN